MKRRCPDAVSEFDLVIDPQTLDRFPDVRVAGFLALDVHRSHEALAGSAGALAAEAAAVLRTHFAAPGDVLRDERIEGWRSAFRACGLKASEVRSSVEQLVRRLLRDDRLGMPLPIVEAYCALSAMHVAPLGAYDLDRLPSSELILRPARAGDSFEPLGGSASKMPLDPRVIVYAAGDEVLCWAFNHRDSARTCLRPETTRAVFIGEALTASQRPALLAALEGLRDVLTDHGASVEPLVVADAGQPRVSVAASRAAGSDSA